VPPFYADIKLMLNREKHPFFEHSEGEFFIARQDKKVVGRLAVLENKPFNKYHDCKKAQFYLFDSINDLDVARALFVRAFEWCKKRGLEAVVGPKGLSALDGYGVQVEGHEHRQMMNMMNYNFPYYKDLFEGMGFHRENDFVSCYLNRDNFTIVDKMREVARRVEERGKFRVVNFKNRREMLSYTKQIGIAYNNAFVNNWEYYPLSEREVKFTVDNILIVAVPKYIKLITYNENVVGFLLGFPDISAAMQRQGGRLTPWALADFMLELRKTKFIALNGVGVLPEYQGRGGNALMYHEMEKVLLQSQFLEGELTQMADTATQVRKDVVTAGAKIWKTHRIFAIDL
jgi:GNAT superfamily N-acetyltransferase